MNSRKTLVVFMGPPGAGKGALSQLCVEKLGWIQLSTGFLCRKHISDGTEIGKQIDFIIKSGKLIDDKLITQMVEEWLVAHATLYKGVILDGFPRSVVQAKALEQLMVDKIAAYSFAIVRLKVPDETIIKRLSARFICSNKDCQKVYSLARADLMPRMNGVCDYCASELTRRADDDAETVRQRLNSYHGYEKHLVEFYQNNGKNLQEINGDKPLQDVFEDFKQVISDFV